MDYCRFAFRGDDKEEIYPKEEDNEFFFPYTLYEDEEEEAFWAFIDEELGATNI